jgi:hypothetical protein
MKNTMLAAVLLASAVAAGGSLVAQSPSVKEIAFDANADFLTLPSYGEVAGVATNSKGHVFVYARTGHAVATLGDERTFYHGGSRLFQFDQNGKYVKEIGQGVYSVNFAQQVRVDPQDNVWIVDAGSNMVTKFDADGRLLMVLGRKPENITLRPGPGVPASGGLPAGGAMPEAGRGGGPGGGRGNARPGSGINGDSFSRQFREVMGTLWRGARSVQQNPRHCERRSGQSLRRGCREQTHPGVRRRRHLQVADHEHRRAAGDLRVGRFDAVSVQLELQRSREHGQRRDLQGAVERTGRRPFRESREARQGVRHRQRAGLSVGDRSHRRRDLELARAENHPETVNRSRRA